jgi:hypothetical protein
MVNKLTIVLVFAILVVVMAPIPMTAQGSSTQQESPLDQEAALAVIGSGTAASCQSEGARNALSSAVAAGGSITFDCGPAPVVMPVDTNATDQAVIVDGGNLVSLSGEDLRQIFLVFGTGDLTLKNITLIDGSGFSGAAIGITSSQAKVSISNSFLTSNDAGSNNGGAIYNIGTLVIDNSTLGSNLTDDKGGGVFNNGGTVTITNSTLISNQAFEGGAIFHSGGSVTVENSAVRSNTATDDGGGIHIDVGTGTVINTTFYDNRAAGGGGIYMRGDSLTITNATFNRNRSDTGGALWNFLGQTRIKNTILANSRNTNDTNSSLNCDGPAAISDGRNIVSDNTCVPNPSAAEDLLSTDPKLELFLNDNGGPTRTFMLLPDSPAIDYGLGCPSTDQRGLPRPIGLACDVGAVEYGWVDFLPLVSR